MSSVHDRSHGQLEGDDERVTTRFDPRDIDRIESMIDAGHFRNRSAAIRAAVRAFDPGGGERDV